jgi:hypothetical protein
VDAVDDGSTLTLAVARRSGGSVNNPTYEIQTYAISGPTGIYPQPARPLTLPASLAPDGYHELNVHGLTLSPDARYALVTVSYRPCSVYWQPGEGSRCPTELSNFVIALDGTTLNPTPIHVGGLRDSAGLTFPWLFPQGVKPVVWARSMALFQLEPTINICVDAVYRSEAIYETLSEPVYYRQAVTCALANATAETVIAPYDYLRLRIEVQSAGTDFSNLTLTLGDVRLQDWIERAFSRTYDDSSQKWVESGTSWLYTEFLETPEDVTLTQRRFNSTDSDSRLVRWISVNIANAETAVAYVTLRPTHSGELSVTASLYADDPQYNPDALPLTDIAQVISVVPTRIDFSNAVRSALFWAVFYELSEDRYASASLEDVWFESISSGGNNYTHQFWYNQSGYPESSQPDISSASFPVETNNDLLLFSAAHFLNGPPFCVLNSSVLGNNDVSAEQATVWAANLRYVSHCNRLASDLPSGTLDGETPLIVNGDLRQMAAQAIVNGYLNYERGGNPNTFEYLISNFTSSIGNCLAYSEVVARYGEQADLAEVISSAPSEYCISFRQWARENSRYVAPIFSATQQCSGWSQWSDFYSQIDELSYAEMIARAEAGETDYDAVIEWLHEYLQCQLHHDNPVRRAVFEQAYFNIMREIDRAIHSLDVPFDSIVLPDPSYGAFSMLDVNDDGRAIVGEVVPSTAATAQTLQTAYNDYMDTIQGFGSGRPYVLRPALAVERRPVWNANDELVAYEFVGYSWVAKSFQAGNTISNLHSPR